MKRVLLKYIIYPKEILHDLISILEVLTALNYGTSYILRCLIIVGTPLLKGGSRTFQNLSHQGWFDIFCQKGGINLKRGLMQKWWGCHFFYYFTIPSHLFYVWEKSSFLYYFLFFNLLIQPCKILIQVFIELKHCIICIFLIHSGSVQKMLTALLKLVQNTQKIIQANFFECQGKMFLNIEKVLVKISEKQP